MVAIAADTADAQRWGRGRGRGLARELQWTIDPEFAKDAFVFARVEHYDYDGGWRAGGWENDYPDSDLNFSYRLRQLTSIEVAPRPVVVKLSDEGLGDYPFLYMANINRVGFNEREAAGLRRYLLNGGFLMADDFWSAESWRHIQREMLKVLPKRRPVELKYDHPIFHLVYDVAPKPQVPSYDVIRRGQTFEYHHGDPEGDLDPHFQTWQDDDGRIMALFCHNNDIGDGWEREGDDAEYFHQYCEQISYPLGVNIITYALTH